MSPENIEQLLTTKDVCKKLQINRKTLQRRIKAGQFPQPIWQGRGRANRWRPSDINKFLDELAKWREILRGEKPDPDK